MIRNSITNGFMKVEDLSGKNTKQMYDYFMKKKSEKSFKKMMKKEMREANKMKNSKNPNWKQASLFPEA